MAQSKALLRFRARLKARGYQDIKIKRCCCLDENAEIRFDTFESNFGHVLYQVTCREPLCGWSVCIYASEPQMDNWPGIEFELGDFSCPSKIEDYFEEGVGIIV